MNRLVALLVLCGSFVVFSASVRVAEAEMVVVPYEPLCTVNIPHVAEEERELVAKSYYLFMQRYLYVPMYRPEPGNPITLPSNVKQYESSDLMFDEACPTVLNSIILNDLYSEEILTRFYFYKHNEGFKEQSVFQDLPNNSCKLSLSFPKSGKDLEQILTFYLGQRLNSFEKVSTLKPLDRDAISADLLFSSSCMEVLADYMLQSLFPADYYELK